MYTDLTVIVNKIQSYKYDVDKGLRLMQELKMRHYSAEKSTYKEICQLWLTDKGSEHSLQIIVCALIRSGLGRIATSLLPSCKFVASCSLD